MPFEDRDGGVPHEAGEAVLLMIDLINGMDFEGGEALCPATAAIVPAVLRLRDDADALGVPVVYVNDNHGH